MRIILSIVGFILLIIALVLIPTSRNFILKKTVEYYVSSENFKLRIGKLDLDKHQLHLEDATIIVKGQNLTTIENVTIDYDFDELLKTRKLNFLLKFQDKTDILGKNAVFDAEIKYTSNSSAESGAEIKITHLASELFSELGIDALEGVCTISLGNGKHKITDCKITDGKARLAFEANIDKLPSGFSSLWVKGNMNELPIDLHKIFHHIVAEDATMQYLYNNISGAMIREGNWEINLDQEFFSTMKMKPENMKGEFKVENIRLKYDPDFPTLEKINTKLVMSGSELNFAISSAYTNETLLSNARVIIDWGVEGDADVLIDADAKGPAANLTNFIPKAQLISLAESGIDLAKLRGVASSKVHIIVPIGDAKNTYDITTNIFGAELSIFDGAVMLSQGRLKGLFNGDIVNVSGTGLVNDFVSQLNFTNFMDEKAEFDNVLDLKTKLAPHKNADLIRPYSIVDGSAILDFSYKNKGEKAKIFAKSSLTNAAFVIDKLGVHNEVGDKAYLEINGETLENGDLPIAIKLIGGSNLQIIANANLAKDITKVSLSKILAHDTNVRGDIEMGKKSMKVKLRGNMLDLSKSNMMQFLAKNADNTSTSLDIVLDRVKLKNNIYLDDFALNIKCDRLRCYKGAMLSKVGTKDFNMQLTTKDDYELWQVTTDNAGAVLKGLGMIDNVKSGELVMDIETRRSDVKAGHVISIANGDFILRKFVTVDNKFLTRLVSFTSIPGLMSLIRNNSDISFIKMKGKFGYDSDVLKISDGQAFGPYMDLTIKGNVYTKERRMKVKGTIAPSKYGPGIVSHIPIIGHIFKMTPYSIEHKY